MFTVDRPSKRISPVRTVTFKELELTERYDLQEWIAHQANALGEELLIIQKEFSGFSDTQERLDLLALDKDGNLVIIENKLDDSGRDVVWQALKYASYCASLTKTQVVEIYQQYLDKEHLEHATVENGIHVNTHQCQDATVEICEFLNITDLEEANINIGNSQRIMFVAATFRKEVTSTALWLIRQGLKIQCIKLTPYQHEKQIFINIDRIIPTPEESEYIIIINAKEAEERKTEIASRNTQIIRLAYWKVVLEAFQKSSCNLYNNISPSKDNWISAGSGISSCSYNLVLGQKLLRIELAFSRVDATDNKFLFDYLFNMKSEIENNFGEALEWLRLDDKKSSRIQLSCPADGFNKDEWKEYIQWHLEYICKLENAMKEPLQKAEAALKVAGILKAEDISEAEAEFAENEDKM